MTTCALYISLKLCRAETVGKVLNKNICEYHEIAQSVIDLWYNTHYLNSYRTVVIFLLRILNVAQITEIGRV